MGNQQKITFTYHLCNSQSGFHLGKEVAVDETMVVCRGIANNTAPMQETYKILMEFFVVADSNTGYVY